MGEIQNAYKFPVGGLKRWDLDVDRKKQEGKVSTGSCLVHVDTE
jgi:hypothetical protein